MGTNEGFFGEYCYKISSSNVFNKDLRSNIRIKLRNVGGEQGIYLKTVKKSTLEVKQRKDRLPPVWIKVPRNNCDATEKRSK